ncbi:lectin [Streptomyces sp. NPDC088560]|uniref:lectin n=1 Tax=Streptomyces sp. NPDC088560 TaxID=3365868 RepID=UPI00382E65C3
MRKAAHTPVRRDASADLETVSPLPATTGAIKGLAGKCLDAAGGSPEDGTPVQIYECNGTAAQQWTIGTDGTVKVMNKCLDVTDDSDADGAKVQLWTCTGGDNQQWAVNAATHDIVNPQANKCLDVTDHHTADGTRAQIWSCAGTPNQKWAAVPGASPHTSDTCWATHYGPEPSGALTANGQVFDNNADTAATSLSRHPQLPFGTRVLVTNVANGKSLVVRINDRGTYAWTSEEPKCLDLTDSGFSRLGGHLDPDDGHIVVHEQILD